MFLERCVWILLLCALVVWAREPGFKTRITSKALDYATQVAIQALTENIQKLRIPDQSGKDGKVKYEVTNIRVTEFTAPTSRIGLIPGQGLKWDASNAGIIVEGDWHYKALFVKDSGSFDAKLSGVSFSLGINLGEDSTGRPSISASSCSSGINDVNFHFHGGASWLYNLFRHKIGGKIKDTLNGQMCQLINKEINEDGENKLKELKVTVPLAHKYLLDYRFTQAPEFQTEYMDTVHKGEIYWLDEPTVESPLVPNPMPTSEDSSSMLYLWISDYTFDTIGYQTQKHGILIYNMTEKDLSPENGGVLNTTCDGFIPKCVGRLIPQIGKKYPNQVVDLRMNSTRAPKMKATSGGVMVNCAGIINMYSHKPGQSSADSAVYLLTLNATMNTTVKLSVEDELLYAQIKDLKLDLKVLESAVGNVSDDFLTFLTNQALKSYLIPQLNDLGKRGFPLLVSKEIKFENLQISFQQNAVQISTDLKYVPGGGALKFQPHVEIHNN